MPLASSSPMNMNAPEPTPARQKTTDWLSIIITLFVLVWIIGVVFLTQMFAWFGASFPAQFLRNASLTASQVFFNAALVQAVLLLLPLVPLALLWRAPRHRAAYRTWLVATLFLL